MHIYRGFDHYGNLDEGLVDHGIEIVFEGLLPAWGNKRWQALGCVSIWPHPDSTLSSTRAKKASITISHKPYAFQ